MRSVFPPAELLTPDEKDELREICQRIALPPDLSELYRRAAGRLGQ